jgi:hypothetical protein
VNSKPDDGKIKRHTFLWVCYLERRQGDFRRLKINFMRGLMTLKLRRLIMAKTMRVDIPEGQNGPWRIEKFEVTLLDADIFNLRAMFSGMSHRTVRPGIYTRLSLDGLFFPMMSDTPAELRDHWWPENYGQGNVLVTGLGLGCITQGLLTKPDVTKVTVIEISQDLIDLVAPHYFAKFGTDRLEIICHDAYTWVPPVENKRAMYDLAWHDIWPEICSDNWENYKKIKRHYRLWVKQQSCWVEETIKYLKRTGR